MRCYLNDKIHRKPNTTGEDQPAIITYDYNNNKGYIFIKEARFYRNGEIYSDNDKPAVILYHDNGFSNLDPGKPIIKEAEIFYKNKKNRNIKICQQYQITVTYLKQLFRKTT